MDYRTFLNKNWGQGATSNAVRAAAWRRLHPQEKVTPPSPPTPAPIPTPSFTPGALDEMGVRNKSQLDFDERMDSQDVELNYAEQMGEINAQRPLLGKARDDGYRSVDNNAAARGVYRSGIRQQGRTNVGEQYDEGIRTLGRQSLNAANRRQQGLDRITGQTSLDRSNNMIDSNVRQKQTFEENNPVVASAAPAKPQPQVKYKDWLKGRKSTANMAAAWRRSQGIA